MSRRRQLALAVDIGGTSTKVGVVGLSGKVEKIDVFPTGKSDPDALVARIRATAAKLLKEHHALGIGIAIAGFVDKVRGGLSYNPNLAWLTDYPLLASISHESKVPGFIEVDSNSAALGEFVYGVGRGSSRFLCLTSGTGLGGGMIVGGHIVRFTGECIGDVGHVIVDPNGPPCSCGGRGCAEAFVGAAAIVQRAGMKGGTLRDVIEAGRRGDNVAWIELVRAGRALGLTMATLAHIFAPDRIAIAGGLSEAGDVLVQSATEAYNQTAGSSYRKVNIVRAELGWQATLIGAAAAVFAAASGEQ